MKKILSEKIFALGLVFIAFLVTYYLYRQGEISFLPPGKSPAKKETVLVELPIREKQYKLSYKDQIDPTFDIANFENNERWFGDGEFDYSTFWEGESSLFLSSYEGQKATATLEKRFDIEGVLNFKLFVYLATEQKKIEEFNLIFAGRNFSYKFPIRELRPGWNFLVLPKENFSVFPTEKEMQGTSPAFEGEGFGKTTIDKVVIELVSRPKTRSIVNLDALWAEKDNNYLQNWNTDSDKFLSIKRNKDSASLLVVNLEGSRTTLKKGSAQNYIFQGKFTPIKRGSFGFFLRGDRRTGYGYYLMVGGIDANSWEIYKYGFFEEKTQNVSLAKGEIADFKIEKDQPYWLKAEMKGMRITFSFSVDGQNFTKLEEVNDTSFTSGGVGIASAGQSMFFVDDLQFFQ